MKLAAVLCTLLVVFCSAAQGEEECIFNEEEQVEYYREMELRFEGSKYVEERNVLLIETDGATIEFRRGGGVHLGVRITYSTPAGERTFDRDDVFDRAVSLVAEYGGELVTARQVADAIRNKNYSLMDASDGQQHYFLGVPAVQAFSISYGIKNGRFTIEIDYYI
jgi:hypothetical protein